MLAGTAGRAGEVSGHPVFVVVDSIFAAAKLACHPSSHYSCFQLLLTFRSDNTLV